MWTAIFVVAMIICGLGWMVEAVSFRSLVYYMKKKQYKLPDNEEIKESAAFAVRHLLKLN